MGHTERASQPKVRFREALHTGAQHMTALNSRKGVRNVLNWVESEEEGLLERQVLSRRRQEEEEGWEKRGERSKEHCKVPRGYGYHLGGGKHGPGR